jgi:protein-S-isoprenylcysteine O-methyltransferase Ste14
VEELGAAVTISASEATGPPDRPGVIALPPLIFLAGLIVGVGLHFLFPLRLGLPTWARWTGAYVLAAALVVAGWARLEFSRAHTNVNPMQPTTAIVTSGPFRITRNPMYLSMLSAFLAIMLMTDSTWLLGIWPLMLAIIHWGVIRREERYLERKFGAEYTTYRARVRRYF